MNDEKKNLLDLFPPGTRQVTCHNCGGKRFVMEFEFFHKSDLMTAPNDRKDIATQIIVCTTCKQEYDDAAELINAPTEH